MTDSERGTRERILEVAESFFAESGYHGTPLHRIAARVGIQKASLFHYFPSKAHIYEAVLEKGFGETEDTIAPLLAEREPTRERLRAMIEAYVDLVAAHHERTRIFLRQSLGDAPERYRPSAGAQHLLDLVVGFVRRGQRSGLFAPIDPTALVLGVVGMVAFFFTSAPVLSEAWADDPWNVENIERVKRHVVEVVQRCLDLEHGAPVPQVRVAAG